MYFPFNSIQLAGIIDKRRPVQTPITDRHFSNTRQMSTRIAQFDIRMGAEGLAVVVSPGARSHRAMQAGWETHTVEVPRFSEHDMVKSADISGLRAPGQAFGGRPLAEHVTEKLDAIRDRFDRTLEYMGIRALQGQVVDGAGNVIADFDVASEQTVDFKTDGTGDNPFKILDDAEVAMSRAVGGDPGMITAYAGVKAYERLRDEGRVVEDARSLNPQQVRNQGRLSSLAGVQVQRVPWVFTDAQGTEQPFLKEDELILAAEFVGGVRLLGPAEGPNGPVMQEWFVDQWPERDPAGQAMRVERNPLPVVRRPEAIRQFKVNQSA